MPEKYGRAAFVRPQKLTHAGLLSSLWDRICAAAWEHGERVDARAHLADMLRPWAHRPIGARPAYPSFVSDDGFPAELSVSWRKGVTEVRVLFEPVGEEPSARAVQDAGRAMVRDLGTRAGVSIGGYEAIEDLFTSDDPPAYRSGVWLSLACGPDTPPAFKVYLNPYANGRGREWDTVTRAMDRLGLAPAWQPIARRRDALDADGTHLDYVALDLATGAQARAKIYFRHRDGGLDGIHRLGSFATRYDAERTTQAAADLYDGHALDNEPMTGLAFRPGRTAPDEANIYFRMPGNAGTDAQASARITALMDREGAPSDVYERIATAAGAAAVHELVSYRTRDAGPADIGVYFRLPVHAATPEDLPRPGHGWPAIPGEIH